MALEYHQEGHLLQNLERDQIIILHISYKLYFITIGCACNSTHAKISYQSVVLTGKYSVITLSITVNKNCSSVIDVFRSEAEISPK